MIIIDTLFEHYEVDESTIMTCSSDDMLRKNAIAAMHSTENTLERVTARALELCPETVDHTFGDWEDACIRGLLELHNLGNKPAPAMEMAPDAWEQENDRGNHGKQAAITNSEDADQAPERHSSGSQTAAGRPSRPVRPM